MTTKTKAKPASAAVDYAKKHKVDPRKLRAQLRRAGLKAPYTEAQIKKALETK
jgi:hypothetical protein